MTKGKILMHYTDSMNYELEKTNRLIKILTLQLFRKLSIILSPDEYATLDMVSINNEVCQRDLARLMLKDRANTGRILSSLEKKGFISRFVSTKNNRLVKKVSVTSGGMKELIKINEKMKSWLGSMTIQIDPLETRRVQETLTKFRLNLEKIIEMNI